MDSADLKSFIEEFVVEFEIFVESARKLYQTPNPTSDLDKIKDSIHNLTSVCMMLDIDNLTEYFRAFEEFLRKIHIEHNQIPFALNKALDMGYIKFKEIEIALAEGKPTEKVKKIQEIETLVEIETFYAYPSN